MQEFDMAPSELCHHLNCCHHQELFVLMALTALALAQVMPPSLDATVQHIAI